jgi:alpha-glucosidase (family GH31 glycosyl hydrolase)
LYGNPNVAHEACGYSKFSPNPDKKIVEKQKDSKYSEELCIRWLQFSSLNPFARVNDFEILPYFKESNKKAVESAFKIRAILNMYIYAYMLKNAISVKLKFNNFFTGRFFRSPDVRRF